MHELRQRLMTAPLWALMVLSGVPFGALVTADLGSQHGTWRSAVVGGVGSGLAFGVVTGLVLRRRFRQRRMLIGHAPAAEVRQALRESVVGRASASPEVRTAAVRVLTTKLAQERRLRHWGAAVLVLFMGLTVFEALTDSPRWWFAIPAWVAAILAHYYLTPRRFQRRIEVLRRE
jgi:hypothetical protein